MGLLSLALALIPCGLAELAGSYGFMAVFVAACFFRHQESTHEHLEILHDFSEELERIMVAVLSTLAGMYISRDFPADFRLYMAPAAMVTVLLIRPLTGFARLLGSSLSRMSKCRVSFYGIRGFGSLYYILYALQRADFPRAKEALAPVTTMILLSVLVHGLSARPVMKCREPL